MKRWICVLLCLCALLSLAACGKKAKPAPTESPVPSPAAAAETPAPTETPSPTPEATPIPVAPSLPPVTDEALFAVFDQVLQVNPGTAGSSLRAAACAARLLDWGAETALTDDEIYSAVGEYLKTLDDEQLRIFLDNILTVYDRSYDLKGESAQAMLADAGVTDSAWPWNERAFRAVEMISYGCGLR